MDDFQRSQCINYDNTATDTSIKPLEYLTSQNTRSPVRLTLYSGLFGFFFFQLEQYFSLTTIQPEQCFQPNERGYWTDIPDVQSHLVPNLF